MRWLYIGGIHSCQDHQDFNNVFGGASIMLGGMKLWVRSSTWGSSISYVVTWWYVTQSL